MSPCDKCEGCRPPGTLTSIHSLGPQQSIGCYLGQWSRRSCATLGQQEPIQLAGCAADPMQAVGLSGCCLTAFTASGARQHGCHHLCREIGQNAVLPRPPACRPLSLRAASGREQLNVQPGCSAQALEQVESGPEAVDEQEQEGYQSSAEGGHRRAGKSGATRHIDGISAATA